MNALSPSNEDSHRAPTPQCDRYAENERGSCLHNAGGYRQPPCRCRSEEHTSELQSRLHLVCRLLLEKNRDMYVDGHKAASDGRDEHVSVTGKLMDELAQCYIVLPPLHINHTIDHRPDGHEKCVSEN